MQPVHTQKCSWNQRINGTAEHCCICIPGRACVERFVDLLAAPLQPRQGEVRVNGGTSAWWQTHTECFTQDRSAGTRNWHREAESRPKRLRQAGPVVLQGVQDLIAELVAKGYMIVYTDGSSKRLSHKDMRRVGGFGVFATEDEQGPKVRFCGYVPTRHRQTNNGAELWAALEAL